MTAARIGKVLRNAKGKRQRIVVCHGVMVCTDFQLWFWRLEAAITSIAFSNCITVALDMNPIIDLMIDSVANDLANYCQLLFIGQVTTNNYCQSVAKDLANYRQLLGKWQQLLPSQQIAKYNALKLNKLSLLFANLWTDEWTWTLANYCQANFNIEYKKVRRHPVNTELPASLNLLWFSRHP